jgi:hypothetical protein
MSKLKRRVLFSITGIAILLVVVWAVPLPTFGRCGVHGDILWNSHVSVGYGLEVYSKQLREAEVNEFPHARDYVGGGCIIPGVLSRLLEQITARATYCRSCVRARHRWMSQHMGGSDQP